MTYRGVQTAQGWWVKATSDGKPYPVDTRLVAKYKSEKVATLYDAFNYGAELNGDQPCMLTREILSRECISTNGKTHEKLVLGEYKQRTYTQVKRMVDTISANLSTIGLKAFDRVALFAETRQEWLTSALACHKSRISVCTLYTTLSEIGLAHALNQTEIEVIFTSYEQMPKIMSLWQKNLLKDTVKYVVIMEDQLEGIGGFTAPNKKVQMIPFSNLLAEVSRASLAKPSEAIAEDIAIIMYTSGSTGTPKGVRLNHTSILASAAAYSVQMNVGPGDRYLAYLPLAHIMELATEVALISLGVTIYYSSPHTLTSNSPKVREGTKGDSKVAMPTTMNSVPLVLDRIIKGIYKAVDSQGWFKSFVFRQAVKYKFWLEYIPGASNLLDMVIFNKVKAELGGQMKRLIAGGAPLSPATHDTFRAIFGCSIQVGYGCTESASCISGMNEDDVSTGCVGGPNACVLTRLVDWKEGGYLTTDKPYPRGEVVVGGPVVADGYFKEDIPDAFFFENGQKWFRTADIGEIDHLGRLRIIDRKKDLVKMKHGEYVSLGNAESTFKTMPVVDNICVFADGTRERTVAVVVPTEDRLRQIAQSVGSISQDATVEQICSEESVRNEILKELQHHGRKNGLTRWDIPVDLCLAPEQWTPDSGLVTAALKLRRKQLGQKYQNMIRDMYSKLDD